ncbi:hypothetical protein FRB99_005717 [Tulasnella sp. 403]|nr:hypothetical protein FRB99_005717 [Tulasnella sp. 403]
MTLLGSLRARSPSPSAELFTARGLINPVNPPSSTASFAAPTTILHQPSLVPSGSLSTPTGTLAPASPSARRTTSKRVLVPKKVANADPTSAQDKENVYPHVPESTKSNTRKGSQIPIPTFPVARAPSKYLTQRTTHAKPAPLQPHSEWKVVPPPPPPRTVGQPHQFASARRYAVSGSNSVRSDTAPKPEPVAILPVKMDDGGSRTTAQRSIRIVTGNSSIRGASLRSTGTVRTQRENTLRTQMEDQLPEPTPLFVKKKKSRLALDLTWALGDRTNAPSKEKEIPLASPSQPPKPEGPTIKSKSSMSKLTMTLKRKVSGNFRSSELTEDASKDSGKERWKWSLGRRGRKDVKDSLSKHAKSPSPPPAIRNIPTFSSATGSAEYEYRTPSLDDHPPVIDLPPIDTEPLFVPTPSTSSAVPSLSASRDGSLRLPLSIHIPSDISALTAGPSTAISAVNASPAPGPRIRFNSYIETGGRSSPVIRDRAVSATFDSPLRESQDMNQDAPTKNHRDSIALRAMRSVRSMARIFVLPEDDTSGHLTRKLSKRAKSKSRASESETGSEPLTRRSSNASQESWLVGAPSIVDNPPPSPGRACGPIDLPIVSSAAREEMTAENRPLSPEVELPRPSVETFGTLRIQKGRMSHDTKRTFSVASNLSELSSGSGKSSASSNRKSNRTSDILRDESTKGSVSSSGRLSFGSIISTRPSKASANRAPSDAPPKGTARKRGSLANLFELAGGIRSSASSKRSSILSRESKASDESHPTGVDTPCTSPCDETPKAKPGVLERIKSFHTLNTIPASPASVFKEIDDQAALEDTLVNRKARSGSNVRPRLPSFEQIPPVPQLRVELDCDVAPQVEPTHPIPSAFPRTPDVNSTVKPRPVSENILGAWGSQRRPATDECPTDGALSLVSAATDELGDLINRLDLSTPDCSPARSHATGHKNSPAPSSLEDARKWQWDPIQLPKGIFDGQAFDENSIPGTTSTFGRAAATKLLRPKQDFLAVPSPLAHPAASETCGLQEDESYVLDGLDSPLKNRRKVDGRTSGLQVLGKSSTGSSLTAVDRSAKGSTGTVLCILKEPGEGDLSMGSENPGDVSLGAFGKGLVDRVEDSREMSEVDDSDIPEELHDILSSRSDSLSLRTEDGRTPFYDISIPSTASALMAKTNLPSIAPPIEICNRPSVRSAPPHPVPAEPLPPAPSMSSRFPVPTDEDDVEDSMDDSILTDSSTGGTSFAVGPADTTLFAVANLDLSLVYPSGEPKAPPREEPSDAVLADTAALVRAVSLSESLDASMSALAKLNVSQADPPKDRPHSSSLESERVAKRHARIANARVNRRLERARNQSTVTASSYGSVINSPDPDPFSYTLAKLEGRIVDSSFNSSRSQNQSTFSIPSISSYGVIINPGVKNPFGYDTSTDSSYASPTGDARSSSDSDRSNFFFNSNAAQPAQADRPRDSFLSTFSANNGPPISLLNRPRMAQYGGRPDSFDGTMFSGPGGVYRSPCSGFSRDRDSIISNVSINRLGRPGLGDKMFESEPLYAISASPPSGSSSVEVGRRESLDPRFSIGSVGSRFGKYSSVSSIFDKTRSRPSSVSSASIFNIDESHASILRSTLPLRVNKQLRPLSMWSTASALESPDEDDTMVTMLGGEQVRIPRAAMGPSVTGSPCVQAEKKRKRGIQLRIIESIAEEVPGHNGSPQAPKHDSFVTSPEHPIIVWDPQINRDSWRDSRDWDTEFGVMLQRYYAFQHQAKEAVEESKLVWPDTEYSRFSLQSFYPPRDPVAIQALIEHSQKTFGPLPLELCVRNPRSRANSRPSPYPMRVAPQHVKLTAFARSHRRTESAERAFECITPFDMPILPAQPASRASLDSVAPSVTMAAPSPSSRDTSQSTSPRATAAEPTDTRRSILSRLRRVPADKTNQFSPLKESGGYKRAESVKSAKHGHHHASAFAKENRETEGHGLLPGPNPSLRISKAKPPRARRAGALSSTMKALRF